MREEKLWSGEGTSPGRCTLKEHRWGGAHLPGQANLASCTGFQEAFIEAIGEKGSRLGGRP